MRSEPHLRKGPKGSKKTLREPLTITTKLFISGPFILGGSWCEFGIDSRKWDCLAKG